MKKSELFFTFLLLPIDLLMVFLAFALSYKFRFYFEIIPAISFEPFGQYMQFVLPLIPVWILIFALNGLYSLYEIKHPGKEFGKIVVAVTAAIAFVMAAIFFSRTFFFSRLIIGLTWIFAILTVAFGRFFIRLMRRIGYAKGIGVRRVLVIGHNSSTKLILNEIEKNGYKHGYKLVKYIDRDGIEKLWEIFQKNDCDEIIIADSGLPQSQVAKVLEFCRLHRLGFKTTPNLFLMRSSHLEISQLAGVPIMEFKRTPLDGWGKIIKRIVDILGSLIAIIVFSPLMLLAALLIKLTDRGPIFFKQERVGYEKNFTLLKFRSMKLEHCTGDNYGGQKAAEYRKQLEQEQNEADGPVFKIKNDPRVTRIGKFLRKTSIDELPQFFNVFKGDMSLIGPRPPLPEEVEKYTTYQKRRLGIKPGITGMWQVSGRSELSFDEWVRLDAYYIENWSLLLDLQIFLKTIYVVIKGKGAA